MSSEHWGLCQDCKWWQIEPDGHVADQTIGMCIDEELLDYQLRVSGNSGCNRFLAGKPAKAAGSSAKPPAATAAR
jgi:hypothetical protein